MQHALGLGTFGLGLGGVGLLHGGLRFFHCFLSFLALGVRLRDHCLQIGDHCAQRVGQYADFILLVHHQFSAEITCGHAFGVVLGPDERPRKRARKEPQADYAQQGHACAHHDLIQGIVLGALVELRLKGVGISQHNISGQPDKYGPEFARAAKFHRGVCHNGFAVHA